jgi:hypothetical protein
VQRPHQAAQVGIGAVGHRVASEQGHDGAWHGCVSRLENGAKHLAVRVAAV